MTTITSLPPARKLAEMARWAITRSDEWDQFHEFVILDWHPEEGDGGLLAPAVVSLIAGDIHPEQYPEVMASMAIDSLAKEPEKPPCAYLLMIEGFGVFAPEAGATPEELEKFEEDRKNRTYHTRPDAREMKMAAVADITGRCWTATKYREADRLEEAEYAYGDHDFGGQMARALVAVARSTGFALRHTGRWSGIDDRPAPVKDDPPAK